MITAAILLVAVILVLCTFISSDRLILKNADTGQVFGRFPLSDDKEFAVTFVHSVNKSPVTDVYQVRGKKIYLIETIYYGFGAGVPSELYGNEIFLFGENGEIIISNMDTYLPNLTYVVGTVSDHTLSINGEEISLRDLCGRNSSVKFEIS